MLVRDDLAGWWIRVDAYVIDMVVLVIGLVVVVIVGAVTTQALYLVLLVLWAVVAAIGYWVWFEGGESGQTLGKRAVGIRVRTVDGDRAGYGRALTRNLVARVIGLIPLVGLADLLWPVWDGRRQCLHDKVGGTVVLDD